MYKLHPWQLIESNKQIHLRYVIPNNIGDKLTVFIYRHAPCVGKLGKGQDNISPLSAILNLQEDDS